MFWYKKCEIEFECGQYKTGAEAWFTLGVLEVRGLQNTKTSHMWTHR